MKNVSIHQPNFAPWLGFFFKVARSDVHVFLDHVEYSKNGWTNRNIIPIAGKDHYLTIPVSKSCTSKRICDIRIPDTNANAHKKIIKTISNQYAKSPGHDLICGFFEKKLTLFHEKKMSDFNSEIILWAAEVLGIETPFLKSSDISGIDNFKKSDLVLGICHNLSAGNYITGVGGTSYLNYDDFNSRGIHISSLDIKSEYTFHKNTYMTKYSVIDFISRNGVYSKDIFKQLLSGVTSSFLV